MLFLNTAVMKKKNKKLDCSQLLLFIYSQWENYKVAHDLMLEFLTVYQKRSLQTTGDPSLIQYL